MELGILVKYIDGTADRGEKKKVEEWLAGDAMNNQYLGRVKKAWLSIDELKELSKVDVNKDWGEVEERLSNSSKKVNLVSLNKTVLFSLGRIAAVFILGVIITSLFSYLRQENQLDKGLSESFYEFNIPEGQKSDLVLPDGTKIMLNAGSKLTFPREFDQYSREVWLEGEAFFEVSKNAARPFFVHTSDINIRVLGTTFNVRAYSDERLIETTLVEGKVSLNREAEGKENFLAEEVTLNPKHKAVFIKDRNAKISASLKREFQVPLKINNILISGMVNTEITTAWTKGKLIFENEYFDVIASRLEKYYGVKILIEDESLKDIRFTGTLKKVSIDQALKALQLTTSFNYKIVNDNVIILTTGPMKN